MMASVPPNHLAIGNQYYEAGTATFFIVRPGRSQILDVVNQHNRIEPRNPIRFQLGYQPTRQRAHAGLELDFDLAD